MKLIRSLAAQGREDYVRGLELEIKDLRAQVANYETILKVRSGKRHSRSAANLEVVTPRYAQSTESSSKRTKSTTDHLVVQTARSHASPAARPSEDNIPLAWNDGVLLNTAVIGDLRDWNTSEMGSPGFLEDTISSAWRKMWNGEKFRQVRSRLPPPRKAKEVTYNDDVNESTFSDYLATKTRLLRRREGLDHPDITIPFERQVSILKRALELAQGAVFSACHAYSPERQAGRYPHGPSMVKFGRDELIYAFGHPSGMGISDWRQTDIDQRGVRQCLDNLIPFRNAICHPSSIESESIDDMLYTVQELAVTLHDGYRAEKVRALRDELREETTQVYEEITFMRALPFAPEWEVHHQSCISRVHLYWDVHKESAIIVTAAKEWSVGGRAAGKTDEDYASRCERESWSEEEIRYASSMSGEDREFHENMRIFDGWVAEGETSAQYFRGLWI